jgi:hypothetical protein
MLPTMVEETGSELLVPRHDKLVLGPAAPMLASLASEDRFAIDRRLRSGATIAPVRR